ncbi:MAG: hypothetical protein KGO83_06870 [Paenibacillaceae bacterium]|jgi:hypothetical protein|nr:hypothetical protein [Paenibacillaceae bacterium]
MNESGEVDWSVQHIADEQLDAYRKAGTMLVVRRGDRAMDVRGTVVAWDDMSVLIRKRGSRAVVKLARKYRYEPYERNAPQCEVDDERG